MLVYIKASFQSTIKNKEVHYSRQHYNSENTKAMKLRPKCLNFWLHDVPAKYFFTFTKLPWSAALFSLNCSNPLMSRSFFLFRMPYLDRNSSSISSVLDDINAVQLRISFKLYITSSCSSRYFTMLTYPKRHARIRAEKINASEGKEGPRKYRLARNFERKCNVKVKGYKLLLFSEAEYSHE